jgi:hypothetical protein
LLAAAAFGPPAFDRGFVATVGWFVASAMGVDGIVSALAA